MMKIEDGGPAFPSKGKKNIARSELYGLMATGSEIIDVVNTGMTLRDYFAAKAMQSLIACTFERSGDTDYIIDNDGRLSLHLRAYEHADAMLKARESNG